MLRKNTYTESLTIKNENFQRKLKAALAYAKNICILGSSNKIDDIRKTNGWSICQSRYNKPDGQYARFSDGHFSDEADFSANTEFDPKTGNLNTKVAGYRFYLMSESNLNPWSIELAINSANTGYDYRVISLDGRRTETGIIPWDALPNDAPKAAKDILSNQKTLFAILKFTAKAGHTQNWYYHPSNKVKEDMDMYTALAILSPYENPLQNPQFSSNPSLASLFNDALLTIGKRQGNCGSLARLVSKYLWEHPDGIFRIEGITFGSVDHVVVVVNRSGDLKNPATWGDDAWVIDAWYENGLIFPAKEFHEKYELIKQFALEQIRECNKVGFIIKDHPNTGMDIDDSKWEIKPQEQPYPRYAHKPKWNVEDYYILENIYSLSKNLTAIDSHKKHFNACLEEIKTFYTNTKHAFFKNKKNEPLDVADQENSNTDSSKRKCMKSSPCIALKKYFGM